jgi:hypothetical protein
LICFATRSYKNPLSKESGKKKERKRKEEAHCIETVIKLIEPY